MKLTDKSFWKMVDELQWNRLSKIDDRNKYKHTEALVVVPFFRKYGEETCIEFSKMVTCKHNELHDGVRKYEIEHNVYSVNSDDGYSDMLYHVVGLGESIYNKSLNSPELVVELGNKGDYKECFGYLLHFTFLKENLDSNHYIKWAKKELNRSIIHNKWTEICKEIAKGKFDGMERYDNKYSQIAKDCGGNYGIANLIGDLSVYSKYIKISS